MGNLPRSRHDMARRRMTHALRRLFGTDVAERRPFLGDLWKYMTIQNQFSRNDMRSLGHNDFRQLADHFIDQGDGEKIWQRLHVGAETDERSREVVHQNVYTLLKHLASDEGQEYGRRCLTITTWTEIERTSSARSNGVNTEGTPVVFHLRREPNGRFARRTSNRLRQRNEPAIRDNATPSVDEEARQNTVLPDWSQQFLHDMNPDLVEHDPAAGRTASIIPSPRRLQHSLAQQDVNDEQAQSPAEDTSFAVEIPHCEPRSKAASRDSSVSDTGSNFSDSSSFSPRMQSKHQRARKRTRDVFDIDDEVIAGPSSYRTPTSSTQSLAIVPPSILTPLSSDRRLRQRVEPQFTPTYATTRAPSSSMTIPPTPPLSAQINLAPRPLPPPPLSTTLDVPFTTTATTTTNDHHINKTQRQPFLPSTLSALVQTFLAYLRHCQKQHRIVSNDPQALANRNYHNHCVEFLKKVEEDLESRFDALTSLGVDGQLNGGGSAVQEALGLSFNCHPNYGFDLEPRGGNGVLCERERERVGRLGCEISSVEGCELPIAVGWTVLRGGLQQDGQGKSQLPSHHPSAL